MATVVAPTATPAGKQATVGIALSASELCVVPRAGLAGNQDPWRTPLQPLNGDGSGWPALTAALQELARRLGVTGGRLEVALMPPLTEIRRLDLPPMGDAELRTLLSRNAARYFVGARAAQLVGTTMAPQGKDVPVGGVIAAAAPLRLIAALHAAAREAAWTVDAVSPAEGAWSAAAATLWPVTARQQAHLLVCGEDRTELLQIDQGRLASVRRFRAGAADATLVAEAISAAIAGRKNSSPTRVTAIGSPPQRAELARALATAGYNIAPLPDEWADRGTDADVVAASFAGANAAPLLRTEATLASRRERGRRVIVRMAMASAALLMAAALFSLWGAKRELAAIRAGRALIRPQISATLVGRTSVENAYRQLAALAAAQRSAVQWSAVIAAMSAHLDDDAYLTALRGRDDSVTVDGVAKRASKAFDSLAGTPGLTEVHAAAPVRRESPQGGPALERFTIAALVRRATAPAAPAAPARKAAP
ncbi:MAG: PilN domain-containing protein [Gemmatimonadaceae bacterium]